MNDNNKNKKCTKCKETKPKTEFHKQRTKSKDGFKSWCKSCSKVYDSNWFKNNKERKNKISNIRRKKITEEIRKFKQDLGCSVCDENDPICLELHHLDPSEKEMNISDMKTHSIERIKKEMDKCVVLCSNCHKKVHAGTIIL